MREGSGVRAVCARVAAAPGARMVYPRIDPAVIMLVHCGPYALLGRQARWTPGRYSCLAGAPWWTSACSASPDPYCSRACRMSEGHPCNLELVSCPAAEREHCTSEPWSADIFNGLAREAACF
jgi:hypothetical protein